MAIESANSLATRLHGVGFSDIVKIRNRILELRDQGKEIFEFHGGEPYFHTPEHIKQAMIEALAQNRTRYAPSSGLEELLSAITVKLKARNNLKVTEKNVIVLNGGMQGLFGAFQSILDPEDELLVFSPYWTPIRDLASMCRAKLVAVPTARARDFGFKETLKKHLTAKSRAIYFNTPQNPTGFIYTLEEAREVAEFATRHDLLVIADEAYEDIVYDGEHISIASLPGMMERTISCYTFSKSYSMTGWRIGYAVAEEPWISGLRKTTLYSTNGVSTPTQYAAIAALQTQDSFYREILEGYIARRDLMVSGLNEVGIKCEVPKGAFYAFADSRELGRDSRATADRLLDIAHVSTVPGSVFGREGEGYLRFSFSTATETIQAGIDSMRRKL
jgi:aspartate aminotransferase